MEQAKHDDKEKLPLQWILSMLGLDDVAKVGAYGAKKYGEQNWRGGSGWMRYAGSCVRHLAHCAYNCLILLTWAKEGKGTDDRPLALDTFDPARDDVHPGVHAYRYFDGTFWCAACDSIQCQVIK